MQVGHFVLLIAIITAIFQASQNARQPSRAEQRREISGETPSITVRVIPVPPETRGGVPTVSVEIVHKRTGLMTRTDRDLILEAVRDVRFYGEARVVLIGETSASDAVVILDSSSGAVLDQFIGYGLTISKSGRYLAFERFYQRTSPEPQRLYLVYDVKHSAADNRLFPAPLKGTGRYQNVGWPVFPPVFGSSKVSALDTARAAQINFRSALAN